LEQLRQQQQQELQVDEEDVKTKCKETAFTKSSWHMSTHTDPQSLKWYCRNLILQHSIPYNELELPPDLVEYLNVVRSTTCKICQIKMVQYMTPTTKCAYFDRDLGEAKTAIKIIDTPPYDQIEPDQLLEFLLGKSHAFILVYDVTKRNSYEQVQEILKHIINSRTDDNGEMASPPVVLMVGNKIDCFQRQQVPFAEALEFATKNGALLKECSVRNPHFLSNTYFQQVVDVLLSDGTPTSPSSNTNRRLLPQSCSMQ